VGDEQDGAPAAPLPAHDLQNSLRQVRRQRCGHLVEHQDIRLDREAPREIDDSQPGKRHPPGQVREVQLREAQLRQPVAERLHRGCGQPEVRSDVEVRDEGRLLVDRYEAAAAGLPWRMHGALTSSDGDHAGVGPYRAREDLYERALARPVRTHEGVDLPRPDTQGSRPQRHDGAVGLRDVGRL
jgi:hypothetical protein